ncbi:hypothetical protein [Microbispora sp. NBRC 16548]|uniref:hypothetical protein n=1 Tax=Microbispora sp. NBRC 16548 TaxID=3030994 RepID=UPI0024A5751A|nr:hypothetical protein [Microbispora sp. NBRC 16548]GLX04485.1 hypothetical protein Misp03_14120 [Microbispora sp. NBRC 16548]
MPPPFRFVRLGLVWGGPALRPRAVLARFGPAVLGLAFGVLALGPALGPGFVLRYDMVFVPDPPLRLGEGFPRAVPSDQVVALLSAVIPAEIVQKAILLGLFVLAASGAAALARDALPGGGIVPRLAAAAFYAWNAYLAQRLLIGQWALLLGYAGLPWAVRAAARGGALRLAAALLPAAVGGFQAMLVSALTVLPVAASRGRGGGGGGGGRTRAVLSSVLSSVLPSLGVLAVLSLPWLVPALVSVLGAGAAADPAGVAAFAPRADGPFGTLGSLLTLGGIWNSHATVPGQDTPALAAVRLALTLVAVAGFVRLGFVRLGFARRPAWWPGLAAAACAGVLIACAGAFAPGVPRALIGWWAGFGPLRDGQVYVAPFAPAQAVGVAVAVAALRAAMPAPVAAAAVAVPVLALPTFALGAFGRLGTAEYPEEWRRVQAVVNGDPAPGALLSLPWSAYRAFPWNGGRVVLDPATKMFSRPVVWNDALVVGTGGGSRIRVAAESPRARRIGALLAGPAAVPLTGALKREGVRYVLAGGVDENTFLSRLPGATPVYRGPELLLVRL